MVFTGALLLPISEHHYTLQAAKRIFMAKSSDPTLFSSYFEGNCSVENNKKIIKFTDKRMIDQYSTVINDTFNKDYSINREYPISLSDALKSHYLARLTLKDTVLLFIYNKLYCSFCKKQSLLCSWRKRSRLQKLYKET